MKLISNLLFMILIGISNYAWSASMSGGHLNGFEIKSCAGEGQKKCIRLYSAEAVMSQFLPLYSFRLFNIEIFENDKIRKISGSSGILDLANRQIVIHKDSGLSDYSINMDTLNEMDYSK